MHHALEQECSYNANSKPERGRFRALKSMSQTDQKISLLKMVYKMNVQVSINKVPLGKNQ